MDFGIGSFLFAFLAGVLSTLSPCVLPLIPIIIGAATNQHRLGPLALAGGLTLSFAVIGTALASLVFSIVTGKQITGRKGRVGGSVSQA